jgi:tripartite-type tricarboxylate transporter receptor subunit TctC
MISSWPLYWLCSRISRCLELLVLTIYRAAGGKGMQWSRSIPARSLQSLALLSVLVLTAAACAPAPVASPTAAPAKPAAQPAATAPAAKPAATAPAAKPAPAASPAAAPAAAKADANGVRDFYTGKTVRFIVGFAAGGGFDAYTRAIAKYIGRYIPGNPTVIVENMPGAGSILAANYIARSAPKDGTAVANIGGPVILNQLFGSSGVEFDLAHLSYLGVPTPETYLIMAHQRAGITKLDELLGPGGKQLVMGGIPASTVEHGPLLLQEVLNANIKVVSGYDGTSKVRLALDSGEIDGICNTWQSTKVTNRKDVEEGNWRVLLQLSDKAVKDLPPSAAGAPTIVDAVRDEEQRRLLLYGTSYPNQFGKFYAAPPGTPAERVAALESAFMKTMEDKEFLADTEKAQLEINPLNGEQTRKLILEMLGMPPDIKTKLQSIMKL